MRLFSGQGYEEVALLRVGCIRWRHDGATIAGTRTGPWPATR